MTSAASRPEPRDMDAPDSGTLDRFIHDLLVMGVDSDDLREFIRSSIEMWEAELWAN